MLLFVVVVVWWRWEVGKRMGGRVGLRMLRGRHVANLFGTNEDAVDAFCSTSILLLLVSCHSQRNVGTDIPGVSGGGREDDLASS